MKTVTVKEISEILNTNPETVRRWIREGKLKAEQATRKAGNIVTEEALKAFLKETPKYARIAASTTSIVSSSVGIPLAIGAVVSSALLDLYGKKKVSEVRIQPEEFKSQISKVISECEENIARKERNLAQLKDEIRNERKKISDLKHLLENVDFSAELVDDSELE